MNHKISTYICTHCVNQADLSSSVCIQIRSFRFHCAFILMILCISACSPPEIEPPKKPKAPAQDYIVSLPASIDLEREIPPLKYEDGTYRVDGLIMQSRKHLNQEISVKGYVIEIARCRNKVGDTCDKPYLWIAHVLGDTDNRMRVVDMKRKTLRRFKVGKLYVFEGQFAQTSKSGYANSRGLLKLEKYRHVNVR